MKFDDVSIEKSALSGRNVYVLKMEMNGHKFAGYFDTMPGFLTAVSDAAKFFMVRNGLLTNAQAKATREIEDASPKH